MSHSSSMLNTPSPEFVTLCQSQIELLTEGFKADWSAVYLTSRWEENSQANLFPVVTYPEKFSWQGGLITGLLKSGDEKASIVPSFLQTLPETISYSERISPSPASPAVRRQGTGDTQIKSFNSVPNEFHTPVGNLFPTPVCQRQAHDENNQIILPLTYEEIVMGLLVTGRKELPWDETELAQIEKIAKTLAIACFLDQRQEWYKQQLQEQYTKSAYQRDRLDNLLHQLRNPLTALRTFGKLLLKRLLSDERDKNAVKGIIRESDRLQDLLRQFEEQNNLLEEDSFATLSALSQSQANSPLLLPSVSLNLQPVSVEEVLTPLLISAQALAQEKDIQVTSTIPPNLPPIQANVQALREVLTNLIDNAIKYTSAGEQVDVSVIFQPGENWEGIKISDTGSGIPRQDQEHIFERRYRGVQAEGDIPGTGLGLAIVKDLVEQMQGKIELISPNGKSQKTSLLGTTFIVWFIVHR